MMIIVLQIGFGIRLVMLLMSNGNVGIMTDKYRISSASVLFPGRGGGKTARTARR